MAKLKRIFTIEIARVTEAAAIAAARLAGRGDEKAADQAAVDAMRSALNQIVDMDGLVVIGEGERDAAPMLYIGEKVGTAGGQKMDIALDPLEGTTLCAKAMPNALAVIAMAESGSLLHAPTAIWRRSPLAAAIRRGPSISTCRRARTSSGWRRPRACRRRTSPPAFSIGRAMPS